MVLRRFIHLLILFSTAAILPASGIGLGITGTAGCGGTIGTGPGDEGGSGAAAPPVSLPAPVTGRLTVTSPDEDGVALVIGDEGAVPADSVVHAVNSTQATAGITPKLVNLVALLDRAGFVSTAEAQSTFPDLCGRTFHGCAVADSDGSFEIQIQAANEDDIGVEIIDATTGTGLSERVHNPVPRNIRHFVRPVLDVALLNHAPSSTHNLYALMGRTADDPNGLVSIVDLATNTRHVVPFTGSLPTAMAVFQDSRTGAIVDSLSNLLAVADLTTENFDAPATTPLNQPRDVVFNTTGSQLIVATAGSNALLQINVATLAVVSEAGTAQLSTSIPGTSNTETVAIDLTHRIIPFEFDLVAFVGTYDVNGTPTALLGLLNNATFGILALTPLPAGTAPRDVAFYKTQDRILVTDAGNNTILIYSFTAGAGPASLTPAGQIADPDGFVIGPRQVTVDQTSGLAFVTAHNGTDARPDQVLTVDLTAESVVDANPIGLGPTGIVFDPLDNILYVSTLKTHSIAFWGLSDLQP